MLNDRGAGAGALALAAGGLLRRENQHGGVLGKIHSALLALPTVRLHVLAGRADVAQRRVATDTELGFLRVLLAALRTLHGPL